MSQIQLDIAPAYPPEAGIERWERTVRLERAGQGRPAAQVVLEDNYTLKQAPSDLTLHLMTSGKVDVSGAGTLKCESPTRPLLVRYPEETFTARVEEIEVTDARLQGAWGSGVCRVVLEARAPAAQGQWQLTMAAE